MSTLFGFKLRTIILILIVVIIASVLFLVWKESYLAEDVRRLDYVKQIFTFN